MRLKQLLVPGTSNAGELAIRTEGPDAATNAAETSSFTATLTCTGAGAWGTECCSCQGVEEFCEMYIGHRARFSMEFELTLDDDTLLTVDEQKKYRGWGCPADDSKDSDDMYVGHRARLACLWSARLISKA